MCFVSVNLLRALLTNNLTLGAGAEPLAQLARTLFGVVRVKDALLGCIVGRQRAEVEPGTLEHAVVGGSKRLDRVKRYVTRLTGCVLASAVSGHMTETARKIVVTGFREDVRVKRCLGLMGVGGSTLAGIPNRGPAASTPRRSRTAPRRAYQTLLRT